MEKEEEKFETIFKKNYKNLCFYALKFVEDESAAQDIVQDVFLNLWDKKEIIELDLILKAYLFKSVFNRCINYLNHKKLTVKHHEIIDKELKEIEISYYSSAKNETHSLFELEVKIDEAKGALPPQCRNVFEMSRFKGLKNREIAEELDISVKVVEKHISKALLIFREKLIDYLSIIILFINLR